MRFTSSRMRRPWMRFTNFHARYGTKITAALRLALTSTSFTVEMTMSLRSLLMSAGVAVLVSMSSRTLAVSSSSSLATAPFSFTIFFAAVNIALTDAQAARVRRRGHPAHEGRQRPAPRDADPEPDGGHDR